TPWLYHGPIARADSSQQRRVLPTRGRFQWFCVKGAASHIRNNPAGLELICRGNSMLHLYFAAFGPLVAATIVAVIPIAVKIKRDRYWRLWLWPDVPKVKSHLSRWL